MFKKLLLTIFLVLVQTVVFGQTVGDYRSNSATGNWTALASWQYYNGTSWVTPSGTTPQGYPGQFIGTGTVTIRNGNDITINTSPPNNFTALVIGEGISGNLIVGADVIVNTLNITINAGAKMKFSGNNDITFPSNAVLTLIAGSPGGEIDDDGTCNNNVALYIGTVKYAVCVGQGNATYTFAQVNSGLGTLDSKPGSYSPVCGSVVNLIGTYSGVINNTKPVTYLWTGSGPSSVVFNNSTSASTSATTTIPGTYSFTLTVSNDGYSNSETISVIFNALPTTPTIGTITQPTCALSTGSVALSGLPASGTWTLIRSPGAIVTTGTGTSTTISGIAAGTYTYTVSNGTCTSVASSNVVINAQPITPSTPTISAGSSTTFCTGGSVVLTSSSASGNTWSTGATTQSITVSSGGTYTVSVNNGTCISATSVGTTVTVNTLPATPTIGTITQPTCALATGSVALSGLPASGTWTLTRSPGAVTSTGTGTSATITGLAVGTYTYTVSNGTCTSVASGNVVIPSLVTNTWNGSVWSTGSAPTSNQNIVFAGNYPPTPDPNVDITACSCQVTSGAVDINAGRTLTLTNGLTVSGGSMFFKNTSSLVQDKNVANSGIITYERSISPSIRDTDYTYWSSPVAGFTVGGVSPTTSYFYSYNSSIDNWQAEASTTVMTAGKGYIIRGPAPFSGSGPPPPPSVSPFIGVPNNGNYSITGVIADRSYLIGNPYPSAIDADKFLLANNTVIEGTIYFWTHNTQIGVGVSNPGTGTLAYSQDDYASYNTTGGVGIGNYVGLVEQVANRPNGKIAAGQGFFATSLVSPSPTTITYTNAMRLDNLGNTLNNTQFFRTSNPKTKNTIEKNRVWLNLTNTQGAFKQMLVGYITGATNEYDNAFDGESFDGNEFVDFYSVNHDKNLVIQGRALPFDINDQVALGFRSTINGAFTIKIDQVDGLFTNQNVFIEDKLTNTVFDLKSGNYTFNTVAGTFNDRFVLRYTNKTLSTNEFTLENQVLVSNKNKQIKINSFAETIDKVAIYDILGRKVYQKVNVNSNELTISSLVSSNQTLIVKTSLSNGETVTDKIVY